MPPLCPEITPIWWFSAHMLLVFFSLLTMTRQEETAKQKDTAKKTTSTGKGNDSDRQNKDDPNKKVDGGCTNNSGKYCSSNMCKDQTNLMNICSHAASLFLIDDCRCQQDDEQQWWATIRRSSTEQAKVDEEQLSNIELIHFFLNCFFSENICQGPRTLFQHWGGWGGQGD